MTEVAPDAGGNAPAKKATPNQKYTVEQVATAVRQAGGLVAPAAKALGCAHTTIYKYIQKHPSIAAIVKEERDKTIDVAEQRLRQAVDRGERWAVAMVLRTQGRDRGYVERHEVEVDITVSQLPALSDGELEELAARVGLRS